MDRTRLERYVARPMLVRVVRPRLEERGRHLIGVTVIGGSHWLGLVRMTDDLMLDGVDFLRLADVDALETHFPRRAFYQHSLEITGLTMPILPRLDLGGTRGLIRTLGRAFALLSIDREFANEGACEIGKVTRIGKSHYTMRLLTPSARWESRSRGFAFDEVTRVAVGGTYERALSAVARLRSPLWA
jgi:hypothetical protein